MPQNTGSNLKKAMSPECPEYFLQSMPTSHFHNTNLVSFYKKKKFTFQNLHVFVYSFSVYPKEHDYDYLFHLALILFLVHGWHSKIFSRRKEGMEERREGTTKAEVVPTLNTQGRFYSRLL